jgi:tetratricopeptide (TPR) repeat protein
MALACVALTAPAFAQAMLKGTVHDEKGEPVEGAKVTIEQQGGTGRKFETRSDRKGEFIQIGLPSGSYAIVAEKGKLAAPPVMINARVGSPSQVALIVSAAGGANTKASQEAAAALRKAFEEGVAASNAGRHSEAIQKFQEGITLNAACADCYNNIGFSYAQMKEYDKAEEAYRKSTEIRPGDAAAYSGLANIYNAQRKFDLAAKASAKATELGGGAGAGGDADAIFNQGVILWNGGKIADAKKAFQDAVAANPNHAEAHYQLGMALVNEGDLAGAASEFETYLKLSPNGANAGTAKGLLAQLKK